MRWTLEQIAIVPPGAGVLEVWVHRSGVGVADVPLRLHSGPWVLQYGYQDAVTGTKDAALPGLVEFVRVLPPSMRLLALWPDELPGRGFLLPIPIPDHAHTRLEIDLKSTPPDEVGWPEGVHVPDTVQPHQVSWNALPEFAVHGGQGGR